MNKSEFTKEWFIEQNHVLGKNLNEISKEFNTYPQAIRDFIKLNGIELKIDYSKRNERSRKTCIEKYGVDSPNKSIEIQNKKKLSYIDKYGVENPSQSEIIKKKKEENSLIRYGTKNPSQNKEVRKKLEETNLKKYGVKIATKNEEVRQKIIDTNLKKYGRNSPCQDHIPDDIFKKLNDINFLKEENYNKKKTAETIAEELGVSPTCVIHAFHRLDLKIITFSSSDSENEVLDFIKKIYNDSVIDNTFEVLGKKELDIYIPDKNLAVEFDGIYWHSNIDKNYHLNKTLECESKGISLIHIFSNEWEMKQDIVKSIISSRLGKYGETYYARNCEIRVVSDIETRVFLEDNHVQGYVPSSVNLGLYTGDKLVSLMTFGKSRFNENYEWELLRFCNKKFVKVAGGASKLFKYFIENYKPKSIISYCDRRYFTGNLYENLGFEFLHNSKPNYFYTKHCKILESRIKYQKHKLKDILENFNPDKTEQENMLENGYRIIYDCGNKSYGLKF